MDAQLKKGLLEACVLASLRDEESYGYKIVSDVSKYIEISESTLYPILKRLELGGCLTTRTMEHHGRLRKYYLITACGLAKLKEFASDWAEVIEVYRLVAGEEYRK